MQNTFKWGDQSKCNLVKGKTAGLLADSHSILNRRKNYFSQLLNVHSVSDVSYTEIHTAELILSDASPSVVEIAIAKLQKSDSNRRRNITV
jgi:hypothetical protein